MPLFAILFTCHFLFELTILPPWKDWCTKKGASYFFFWSSTASCMNIAMGIYHTRKLSLMYWWHIEVIEITPIFWIVFVFHENLGSSMLTCWFCMNCTTLKKLKLWKYVCDRAVTLLWSQDNCQLFGLVLVIISLTVSYIKNDSQLPRLGGPAQYSPIFQTEPTTTKPGD